MARRLIVTADDFGLTRATSVAILEAHRRGVVTATSILGNGPATADTLALLADAPALEPGLHLALVGEDPPVAEAHSIPTLVDRRGRLAPSWRHLVARLAARRVDPDDLARELRAQLDRLAAAGVTPTHLNAHQHLQLWPAVATVVIEAATAAGIGFVRTPRSARSGPAGRGIVRLADGLAARLAAAGLATSDGFVGLDEAGTWDQASLAAALATVPGAVVELNVHPGPALDPDRARYRWDYAWAGELDALCSPGLRAAIDRAGWELVGPCSASTE